MNSLCRALMVSGLVVASAACGPPVHPTDDAAHDGPVGDGCQNCTEGGVDGELPDARDGSAMDGDAPSMTDGSGDDGTGGDGSMGDASTDVAPGSCMPLAPAIKIANERRVQARPVFVRAGTPGFVAGARAQRGGLDNAYFARINADGTLAGDTSVSDLVGPIVSGGSFAPSGSDYVMAYSHNADTSLDVYVRRVSGAGVVMGAATRVTMDMATSDDAQIVAASSGWIVVWRSREDTGVMSLMASAISPSLVASAPVIVTPAGATPGSFEVVADAGRVAVAYVDQRTATADLWVSALGASGAPTGMAVQLTTGAVITDSIGLALRGDQATTIWAARSATTTLRLRRANLTTGAAEAVIELPAPGLDVSKPGIGLDGMGYVIAFRRAGSPLGTLGMMRLNADLSIRDGVSTVDMATTGDAVHVASRGDGTYAIGWADDFPSGTVANVRVMRCP